MSSLKSGRPLYRWTVQKLRLRPIQFRNLRRIKQNSNSGNLPIMSKLPLQYRINNSIVFLKVDGVVSDVLTIPPNGHPNLVHEENSAWANTKGKAK